MPAGDHVDLLPAILPDVGDVQVARLAIERIAPRIAQPARDGLDLGPPGLLHVEPQHLRQERVGILAVPVRIVRPAAVAQPDVQLAVGAEDEVAAVVVVERLLDVEQLALVIRAIVLDDARVAFAIGVVDVEAPVLGELGMKREAEQPLLRRARHAVVHVEKWLRVELAAAQDAHVAHFLDDEQPPLRIARRERQRHRLAQSRHHALELHAARDVGRRRRRRRLDGQRLGVGATAGQEQQRDDQPHGER